MQLAVTHYKAEHPKHPKNKNRQNATNKSTTDQHLPLHTLTARWPGPHLLLLLLLLLQRLLQATQPSLEPESCSLLLLLLPQAAHIPKASTQTSCTRTSCGCSMCSTKTARQAAHCTRQAAKAACSIHIALIHGQTQA